MEGTNGQKSPNPLLSLYKQVEKLASNNSNGSVKSSSALFNGTANHGCTNGTAKRSASSAPLMVENELGNG